MKNKIEKLFTLYVDPIIELYFNDHATYRRMGYNQIYPECETEGRDFDYLRFYLRLNFSFIGDASNEYKYIDLMIPNPKLMYNDLSIL